MARQKLGIEGQIMVAIKRGYTTNSELSGYLCVGRSTIDKTCTDMVIAGMIHAKKVKQIIIYSLIEEVNAHDPFGLCRASLKDKKDVEPVLESDAVSGFGERKRHLIEDTGRGDSTSLGDSSKYASRYGEPKELRDII
jgi:hypothetical protein